MLTKTGQNYGHAYLMTKIGYGEHICSGSIVNGHIAETAQILSNLLLV